MAGPRLVRAFAEGYPRAVFAEIGANDGEQHDFLRPLVMTHEWRGVVAEPVPYVFDRLAESYRARPGIALENVAVGAADATLPFFHLAEVDDHRREGLPRWYDGIGSFSREEVLSHSPHIPDIAARLVATEVPCLTLDTLLTRNGLERLDLLVIDTEGHDWEIIRHADLRGWMPRLLIYEHYHLGAGDRRDCRLHLEGLGYETMEEHFDTFCLDPEPDDALTGSWRRMAAAVPGVAAYEER